MKTINRIIVLVAALALAACITAEHVRVNEYHHSHPVQNP